MIATVNSPAELAAVRQLFQEYWDSFGFTPCFQGFESEVAGLPGDYAPPAGRLALAWIDGTPAGCVALRRIDATRCEAKRLYVRPAFRGRSVGRTLLDWVISEARAAGYCEMLADTMPVMADALSMYERKGFERIPPYSDHPTPGAICIRLDLLRTK
jgi:GNAT superfamily N-acetyltransferase